MDNRPAFAQDPQPETSGHAELLRVAAETLRGMVREVPRGPWRWGEPDLAIEEPLSVGIGNPISTRSPHARRWRGPAESLETTTPVVHPPPAWTVPIDAVGPGVAEALATLLEQLAKRIEDGATDSADEVERAAVAVAGCVIHAAESTGAPAPAEMSRWVARS
jgi:hypothetical protein